MKRDYEKDEKNEINEKIFRLFRSFRLFRNPSSRGGTTDANNDEHPTDDAGTDGSRPFARPQR